MTDDLEQLGINVIRGLALDAPNRARSGHQGTAMALAPLAHVLFTRIMKYDATDPDWPDRDRFVLSAGHASILQYALLHLTGFGLTMDDLEHFRQWDSPTPGHPEYGHTAGVETTTGPLGQGFGNAVGMAMAERWLRARFGEAACDHFTYTICGDGDLSEGVSHEAASLAGHQHLGRLIAVYDDNHITIDGPTEFALTDDAAMRFAGYGWHVENLGEASEDLDALEAAINRARAIDDAPSLIIVRSHIGYPSPSLTDSPSAHGLAFGDAEISEAKAAMGLPDQPFLVPDEVRAFYRAAGRRGAPARAEWTQRVADLPDAGAFRAVLDGAVDPRWTDALPAYDAGSATATRKASQACLHAAAAGIAGLVAGAADLTGNTGTKLGAKDHILSVEHPDGRQLYFGVREHGMGTIMNGLSLHGLLPVGGTFLVFSDYMRGAIRLAALMGVRVIYSFTHDSVGVGEDGPTHQPVEQIAALRAMPGLQVIRPADGNETAAAWQMAVAHDGPTALVLTRQDVPTLEGVGDPALVARGGYIVRPAATPDVVLVGAGSEVQHCVGAADLLADEGISAQVVSLPCFGAFDAQNLPYRHSVLPPGVPAVSCEAGVSFGWGSYADAHVSIDRFGASAPADVAMAELGITAEHVAAEARTLLSSRQGA
jgi:transketolase